jgi:hypothetical protein
MTAGPVDGDVVNFNDFPLPDNPLRALGAFGVRAFAFLFAFRLF